MPYSGDPPGDSMADRLEEKLRDLLQASSDFNSIRVFYRGEPGFVPVKLHPFVIIFLAEEQEATGQEGYGNSTGMRYYRYDGYVAIEVLMKDTSGLMPDGNRDANVPSYLEAKTLTQAAFNALMSWGGARGLLVDDPVVSFDGRETASEMRIDPFTNGLGRRGDNVTNRGALNFHIYTRRLDFD